MQSDEQILARAWGCSTACSCARTSAVAVAVAIAVAVACACVCACTCASACASASDSTAGLTAPCQSLFDLSDGWCHCAVEPIEAGLGVEANDQIGEAATAPAHQR